MSGNELLISLIISLIISAAVLLTHSLTSGGTFLAFLLMNGISYCIGLKYSLYLIFAFFLIAVADKIADMISGKVKENKKPRNIIQVACNGLIAGIMAVIACLTDKHVFIVSFMSVISESLCDSLASDLGVLSHSDPVDILTFKTVDRGLSGGISVLGTLSAAAGGIITAVFCILIKGSALTGSLVIFLSSFLGVLFDSVLGSSLQPKYRCRICGKMTDSAVHCGEASEYIKGYGFFSNNMVNFSSNIFTSLISIVLYMLLI